ncbi:MAG: hypothetical protein QOJ53_2067 [Sphingomonadales bacterium]|jgi:hypothetical protein|nr:hypothetical protein [Sphingomonadales bacterium]
MWKRGTKLNFFPAETLPSRFDIVKCRFPYRQKPDEPGPKERPGLVFDAGVNPADGHPYVFVHYGSGRNFDDMNPFQFVVGNYRDIGYSGLDYQTRFDLLTNVQLPWCAEFIAETAKGLVLGRLPDRVIARLKMHGKVLNEIANMRLTEIYAPAEKHGELLHEIAAMQSDQNQGNTKREVLRRRGRKVKRPPEAKDSAKAKGGL